jgi:tetratricopeptide (TPR) repeat protein
MMRSQGFGVKLQRALLVAGLALGVTAAALAEANPKAEDLYLRTEYRQSLALLSAKSNNAAENNLAGRNYFMMGDFKRAIDYFQRAADAEPGNSSYALWLGRAWGRRAETSNPIFAPGYATKARQWMEAAVQLNDKNGEALSDLFDYYLEAPGFLGGGYDKAQVLAHKISAVDPAEGFFARARLAEKKNEYGAAEEQLRQAVALAPRQVGRVLDLAKFLANQGKQQESDALFVKAENMAPQTPKVWYARADALIRQKRNLGEAKRLLEKYLQSSITPDDPSKGDAQRLLKQATGGA